MQQTIPQPSAETRRPTICIILSVVALLTAIGAGWTAIDLLARGHRSSQGELVLLMILGALVGIIAASPWWALSEIIAQQARTNTLLARMEWWTGGMAEAAARAEAARLAAEEAERAALPHAEYFCGFNGKESGPYRAEHLRSMLASGTIKRDTPVYRRGTDEWKTFADFPELA